ncbi:MAG TPA: hypothetical protein PKC19_17335 [Roseiflexaceae bacterium]|nr:hypothetical protein [Roseiflexaceae bacterium]
MTTSHLTPIAPDQSLFRDAVAAVHNNDRQRAMQLFSTILRHDPRNEVAWVWLARVVDDPERRRYCLERALALNPANSEVQRLLNPTSADRSEAPRMIGAPAEADPAVAPTHLPRETPIDTPARGSSPLNERLAAAETRRVSQPRIIRETDPAVKQLSMIEAPTADQPAAAPQRRKVRGSEPMLLLRPFVASTPAEPARPQPRTASQPHIETSAAQLLATISAEQKPQRRHSSGTLRSRLLEASLLPAAECGVSAVHSIPGRRPQNLVILLLAALLDTVLFVSYFILVLSV